MPSPVETQRDVVRIFIEASHFEEAIDSLAKIEGFQQYASAFRSRLSRIQDQNRKGLLPRQEAVAEYNKLTDDILGLISEDFITFDEDQEAPESPYSHLRPVLKEPPFILPQLDISSFTGRQLELQQLESVLFNAEGPRVAGIAGLTGAGGMGKSVLAFHFGTIYRDRFPDGVIGLRVDGSDPEIIAQRFASSAGVVIPPSQKLTASEIMQSAFQNKQALLIFDNAQDATVKLLRPGGNRCAVIVTTRNKGLLKNLEIPVAGQVDLDPFNLVETRALLGKIIGSQRVEAEPEAVERIYDLVGGLPLAIRIVGGALDDQPFTSVAEFAQLLDDEKARLALLRDPDDPDLNVEASFELSLKRLEQLKETEVVRVFACLGACPPEGFSLLAAQVVSEQDEIAVKGTLGRLVRLSLVNQGELTDEFTLHPLLFLFARRKAEDFGWLSGAEQRHTDFFLNYVQNYSDPSIANFKILEAELNSLLLAGRRLAAAGRPNNEFYVALEPFLEARGHWSQALGLIDLFAEAARANNDFSSMAQLSLQRGQFLQLRGKFEEAKASFLESESLTSRIENVHRRQHTQAMVLNSLGSVYQRQGKFEQAVLVFEQSKQISEKLEDERSLAMVLNSLGGVYQRQGKFEQAVLSFEQCRQISEALADERGLAMILNSLGGVYQRQGRFKQAVLSFEQSKRISEKLGDEHSLAMVLNSLGGVYQRQGRFEQAVAAFEQSKQISEALGDERSLAMVLNSLGGVYQRQGKFEQAVLSFEQCRQISEALADERGLAMVFNSLGSVYQRQGKFEQAVLSFEQSKKINEKLSDERSLAMILNSLGSVYQRQGKFEQAITAFEQSQQISEKLGDERSLAMVFNSLGSVYQRQGKFEQAVSLFEQCRQAEEKIGNERGLAMVLNSLGGVYQRQGKFEQAITAFEQSQQISKKLGDERGVAMTLNSLGSVYQRQGRFEQAVLSFEQCRQISEALGDERGLAMVFNSLGSVYQRQGKFKQAVLSFEQSKQISEALGDERGLAMVLNSLGGVYQRQGKFEQAVSLFEQCRQVEEKIGNERGLAMVLNSLGILYQQQGNLGEAVRVFDQSACIEERLGNRRGLAMVLCAWGKALLNHSDQPRAADKLTASFEIDEALQDVLGLRIVTPPLIRVLTLLGRKEEARNYVNRALTIAPEDRRLLTLQRQLGESHPVSSQTMTKTGAVKRLIRNVSGYLYGFIVADDGSEDIYFGEESIAQTLLPNLTEGIKVKAEVELSARGPRARHVWMEDNSSDSS